MTIEILGNPALSRTMQGEGMLQAEEVMAMVRLHEHGWGAKRIAQEFGFHKGVELEMAQLQQPDGLHELRREGQRLRLPDFEPGRERHGSDVPCLVRGDHAAIAVGEQEACQTWLSAW